MKVNLQQIGNCYAIWKLFWANVVEKYFPNNNWILFKFAANFPAPSPRALSLPNAQCPMMASNNVISRCTWANYKVERICAAFAGQRMEQLKRVRWLNFMAKFVCRGNEERWGQVSPLAIWVINICRYLETIFLSLDLMPFAVVSAALAAAACHCRHSMQCSES